MIIRLNVILLFWTLLEPSMSFQNAINSPISNFYSQQQMELQFQSQGGSFAHAINSPNSMWHHSDPPVKDFVTIEQAPSTITRNMLLKMKYQCSRPTMITIMIDGYEDDDSLLRNSTNPLLVNDPTIFFKTSWQCSYTPVEMKATAKAKLPKRFLYRPNILMPKVSTVENLKLKAFMTPLHEWTIINTNNKVIRNKMQLLYENSKLKFNIPLKALPPMQRPAMRSRKCLSWHGKLAKSIIKEKPLKSIAEEECAEPIRYPAVMSEEPYGVILGFYPFYNSELQRKKKSNKLRFTLSMEVYLFSYCEGSKMCSLFHHLDGDDVLEAPILLLDQSGHLYVQVKAANNNSYAQGSTWSVPLRQWIRINYMQTNSMTNVKVYYGKNYTEFLNFKTVFHFPLTYNEAKGYMVVGGSVYCKNINGIVAYSRFCRNKALSSEGVDMPNKRGAISEKVLKSFKKQQRSLRSSIQKRWQYYSNKNKTNHDVCIPYFLEIFQNATKSHQQYEQCPVIDYNLVPSRLENVEEILNDLPSYLKSKDVLTQTKSGLYKKFLMKLENPSVMKNITTAMKLLKQATRLGHKQSHFLLYSIYKNGIGIDKNLIKARIHLLLGAQLGDDLCLKTLAYSHLHGLGGFPEDISLAFFYYFNLAHKTQKDLLDHVEGQAMVNTVRLTEEKQVKEQMSEGDDVFEWLKLQAAKGAFSAQRNMAKLLYWGHKGLQRNLQAALKYYEDAAKDGDPIAMYDYGLALIKTLSGEKWRSFANGLRGVLKLRSTLHEVAWQFDSLASISGLMFGPGHGGEVDMDKGLEVMRQAAEVENPSALNTMGWYYATEEVNMTKAVEYFEKADKLGSMDAAYNLGHMYHTGKYPGKNRDMKMAFTKYYRAAGGGHIEASLQVAYLCTTGIQDFIPRNPKHGVEWAKYLAEKNPTMGELIREGLQAFRKQHWSKSLFIYLSLAETGFEVAQYNTAFLCETDQHEVTQHIEEECVWKNWNLTARMKQPHPYALNKMGDYHYYGYGGEATLDKAIEYYAAAAKLKFPQALFNLANIMEVHGDVVNNNTLLRLSLPKEAFFSPKDTIVHLYRKCTEIDSSDTSLPCYIALMRTQLFLMWERTSFFAKVLTFLVILITTFIMILLNMLRKRSRVINDDGEHVSRVENGWDNITPGNNITNENHEAPTTILEQQEE